MTSTEGAPWFDLQSHSVHSDGALSVTEVVRRAHAAGVQLLAVSDHDTVAGVDEALAAGRAHGISVVSAVELSAVHGEHEDLHILGYGIRHRDPDLLAALTEYRADRGRRALRMAQALTELGFHVDHARLDAHTAQGNAIGRPHLARAVVEDAANQDRIADEELVDPTLFLQAYLLPGRPAYRGRTTPTVQEAIATIHRAGGLAVWAHPFWDIADQEDVLATAGAFQAWGLDGVEAFYATHDRSQTLALCDLCRRTGLLSTGSSDFHGPDHRLFHQFRAFSLYGREPNLGPIADAAHAQSSPHETSQTAH